MMMSIGAFSQRTCGKIDIISGTPFVASSCREAMRMCREFVAARQRTVSDCKKYNVSNPPPGPGPGPVIINPPPAPVDRVVVILEKTERALANGWNNEKIAALQDLELFPDPRTLGLAVKAHEQFNTQVKLQAERTALKILNVLSPEGSRPRMVKNVELAIIAEVEQAVIQSGGDQSVKQAAALVFGSLANSDGIIPLIQMVDFMDYSSTTRIIRENIAALASRPRIKITMSRNQLAVRQILETGSSEQKKAALMILESAKTMTLIDAVLQALDSFSTNVEAKRVLNAMIASPAISTIPSNILLEIEGIFMNAPYFSDKKEFAKEILLLNGRF
jgi:hypothetical protein